MLILTKFRALLTPIRFQMSSKRYNRDLLTSKFHQFGYRHFLKSKPLTRNITTNVVEIEQTQLQLDKIRKRIIEDHKDSSQFNNNISEQDFKAYFKAYQQLIILMKESQMNEEWYYRIVGWFNIRHLFTELIEKMMTASTKGEHVGLVQTLSWMNPRVYSPPLAEDLREQFKQQRMVDRYYKKLNIAHNISFLKNLEEILQKSQSQNKAKYYSNYLDINLPKLIKKVRKNNASMIDDIFWLMNMYIESLNDKRSIIEQFQFFLKRQILQLSVEQINTLINIYGKVGKVDNQIYDCYIRPYLLDKIDSSVEDNINNLKFVVYSEASDEELISLYIKALERKNKSNEVNDNQMQQIHLLVHYLKIKGVQFLIGRQFNKQLQAICRHHQGNKSVSRTMTLERDEKNRRDGSNAFISDCLKRPRGETTVKQDQAQTIKPELPMKRYTNIRFCVIEINNCIFNKEDKQAVILEKNYNKFQPSQKLERQRQVRDTVLKHYGFKVNNMRSVEKQMKKPPVLEQQEQ